MPIIPSAFQVNEGDSLNTSLSDFTPNTTLYFKVSGRGISKNDLAAGAVKGSIKVDANGVATIAHTLRADKKTEGDESFAIQVFSDKKMRNLLGQSDAVTVFDTAPRDIITGIWRNDRLAREDYQTGLFKGGRIKNGRFFSDDRFPIVRDSIGEKFKGILYLDKNKNRIFDNSDHQFGWYWEYEFDGDDEGKNVLFNGGASRSGNWSYQRGNAELDMYDPLLPGQKHAGPIFITDPSVF